MKRTISALLCILLLLSTISACTAKKNSSDLSEDLLQSSLEPADTGLVGTEISKQLRMLDYIELDKEDIVNSAVVVDDKFLVITYSNSSYNFNGINVYDLFSGQLVREIIPKIHGMATAVSCDDGSFYVTDYYSGYEFFDSIEDTDTEFIELAGVDSSLSGIGGDGRDPSEGGGDSEIVYTTDIYSFYEPKKFIHTYDAMVYLGEYGKGETLLCDLSDYYDDYIFFLYNTANGFCFSGTDKYTFKSDKFEVFYDGSFKYLGEYEYNPTFITDSKIYLSYSENSFVNILLKESPYYSLNLYLEGKDETVSFADDNYFATYEGYLTGDNAVNNEIDNSLRIYTCDKADLIYKTEEFADKGSLSGGCFFGDSYAFVYFSELYYFEETAETTQTCFYYVIDFSDANLIERERTFGVDLQIPFELEAELERNYDVEIFTREDAIISFPDFYAQQLDDLDLITNSLEALKWVMDKCPPGFFQELFPKDAKNGAQKLKIMLTGTLTPANNTSTSYPAAYAYYDYAERAQIIVMDATQAYSYSLKTNFSHELMHAIETRIGYITNEYFSGFDKWDDYLPENFSYNLSYRGIDGLDYSDETFTNVYTEDPSQVYFIDAYSKTFPTEDKARLFEYLFMSEDALAYSLSFEHVKARAVYLCSVIRDAFVSVRSSNDVWWEQYLY